MNAKLISFARLLVRILIVARQSPYPLNSTQNHLINSTLPIFNLSTQPSISPGCKHPKTKKSESRKRTPNSRKCLVFKPFSVFTSVLLTSTLRTQHVLTLTSEHTPFTSSLISEHIFFTLSPIPLDFPNLSFAFPISLLNPVLYMKVIL